MMDGTLKAERAQISSGALMKSAEVNVKSR